VPTMLRLISRPLARLALLGALLAMAVPAGLSHAADVITITVVGNEGPAMKGGLPTYWQSFEKAYPNIKIRDLLATSGLDQTKLLAAGNPPDLLVGGDVWSAQYAPYLEPLDGYAKNEGTGYLKQFDPVVMQRMNYRGALLWLPLYYQVSLLYYNKDLFDQAKLAYPTANWTYQTMINAGQKLTKHDAAGKVTQWGAETVFGWWGEWGNVWLNMMGGRFITQGRVSMNTPQAVKALTLFQQKVTPGPKQWSPGVNDSDLGGFAGGKVAMIIGGHVGTWPSLLQSPKLKHWDIAPLPKGPTGDRGGEFAIQGYGISKFSKHKGAAWLALKWLVSAQGAGGIKYQEQGPVALTSLMQKEVAVPHAKRLSPQNTEALQVMRDSAVRYSYDPDLIPLYINVAQPDINKLMAGKLTATQAAEQIEKDANAYYDSVGR